MIPASLPSSMARARHVLVGPVFYNVLSNTTHSCPTLVFIIFYDGNLTPNGQNGELNL